MIESSFGCRGGSPGGWVSGGEASAAGEGIDRGFVGACGDAETGVRGRAGAGDLGHAGDEEPLAQPGEEEGVADAAGGDVVPWRARDAVDEAGSAEPPQLVGDLAAGHVRGMPAKQRRELVPQ